MTYTMILLIALPIINIVLLYFFVKVVLFVLRGAASTLNPRNLVRRRSNTRLANSLSRSLDEDRD